MPILRKRRFSRSTPRVARDGQRFFQSMRTVCAISRGSHLSISFTIIHRSEPMRLIVKPFLQDVERGVFATRAPCRPNPIGLSIVELVGREDHVFHLNGLDVLDGTPLLDIKPFIPRFDRVDDPSGVGRRKSMRRRPVAGVSGVLSETSMNAIHASFILA